MKATPLNRATVVRGAVRLADQRGLDSLTMRSLGEQLGVGAMALYRHVAGREALLEAMVGELLNGLAPQLRASEPPAAPGAAPYLERSAHIARDLSLAHPWLVRLMVARPPANPTLDPRLATTDCTDAVLAALAPHHSNQADSLRTYREFCAFLLGHLLLETPPAGTAISAEFDRSLQTFLNSIRPPAHHRGPHGTPPDSDSADHTRPGAPR